MAGEFTGPRGKLDRFFAVALPVIRAHGAYCCQSHKRRKEVGITFQNLVEMDHDLIEPSLCLEYASKTEACNPVLRIEAYCLGQMDFRLFQPV